MGFFSKMLGQEQQYPNLADDSTAAKQLAAINNNLEKLAKDVRDPMEVIPSDKGAFVFIGKPPKKFGIAWIEEEQIKSFKTLMDEHGLTSQDMLKLTERLRQIYVRHQDSKHFNATIANRDVVVTPSKPLENDVREVLTSLN